MAENKNTSATQPADISPNSTSADAEPGAGEDKPEKTEVESAAERKPAGDGILPKKASEDDPRRWGDESGYDHDAWLKEQRPPHWG